MTNVETGLEPHSYIRPVADQGGCAARIELGCFGDDDQIGCLNFLTAAGVIEAAALVRKGSVFRLDAPIGYSDPTLFGRTP